MAKKESHGRRLKKKSNNKIEEKMLIWNEIAQRNSTNKTFWNPILKKVRYPLLLWIQTPIYQSPKRESNGQEESHGRRRLKKKSNNKIEEKMSIWNFQFREERGATKQAELLFLISKLHVEELKRFFCFCCCCKELSLLLVRRKSPVLWWVQKKKNEDKKSDYKVIA